MIHALNPDAKRFYESYGFQPFEEDGLTLYVLVKDVRTLLPEG